MENQLITDLPHLITYLNDNGYYLGGSRNKLKNYDIRSETDWDYNATSAFVRSPWFQNNFDQIVSVLSNYADNLFVSYWKHKIFDHVSVVERKDLDMYREIFETISIEFWKKYLWKSTPTPTHTLSRKRQINIFNQLYYVFGYNG